MPSVSTILTVNTTSSSKRLRLNEKSSTLWHKRLSHIFRQRIERLIKDEILPNLDLSNFDTYVGCIKGKLITKVRNVKIDRCNELLGVIYVKPGKNKIFLKNGKNNKIEEMVQGSLDIFLDLE